MGSLGWARDQTHLLSPHLDVVVEGGDDDVFGGEVSHVHCKLVGIPKGLDVSLSSRTGCGQGCCLSWAPSKSLSLNLPTPTGSLRSSWGE